MNEAVSLEPLRLIDTPQIGTLAKRIWREHYTSFISEAQIEYMLRGKYGEDDLSRDIGAPDRWFEVLRVEGVLVGFLRCVLKSADQLKLEEIYLASTQRGMGFGHMLLERAEWRARDLGCSTIMLYVNKRNKVAVQAYLRSGFVVHDEAVFDIGGGFVMDDYLMVKHLSVSC